MHKKPIRCNSSNSSNSSCHLEGGHHTKILSNRGAAHGTETPNRMLACRAKKALPATVWQKLIMIAKWQKPLVFRLPHLCRSMQRLRGSWFSAAWAVGVALYKNRCKSMRKTARRSFSKSARNLIRRRIASLTRSSNVSIAWVQAKALMAVAKAKRQELKMPRNKNGRLRVRLFVLC